MVTLIIPGEPVAKARPRWAKWGTYTPKKTVDYEVQVKERFASEYPGFQPLEGALYMTVDTFFAIPASASAKKRKAMLGGEILPTKRPDADNVWKTFGDALQGLAFRDDSQIVEARISKRYSATPRAVVTVRSLSE
jgi:Holliday junction resolvase RusA-like endonuclease